MSELISHRQLFTGRGDELHLRFNHSSASRSRCRIGLPGTLSWRIPALLGPVAFAAAAVAGSLLLEFFNLNSDRLSSWRRSFHVAANTSATLSSLNDSSVETHQLADCGLAGTVEHRQIPGQLPDVGLLEVPGLQGSHEPRRWLSSSQSARDSMTAEHML